MVFKPWIRKNASPRTNGVVSFLLTNHLASTSVTLDEDGDMEAGMRYDAWGVTRTTFGSTPTTRHYTGQHEAEAGLYFYNARWYDPSIGRFAQADTIIPEPGDPLAWDRYAYVKNNPIKYIAPSEIIRPHHVWMELFAQTHLFV